MERRDKGEMRSGRAYVAAFGTSGSLLAVAALLFVFASAFVSFRGFPQVAAAVPPQTVTVTPAPGAPVSATARRLSVVLGPAPRSAALRRPRSHAGRPPATVHPALTRSGGGAPPRSPGARSAPRSRAATGFPARKPSGGSGAPASNLVGQAINRTSRAAQQVVSNAVSTAAHVGTALERTVESPPPPSASSGGGASAISPPPPAR